MPNQPILRDDGIIFNKYSGELTPESVSETADEIIKLALVQREKGSRVLILTDAGNTTQTSSKIRKAAADKFKQIKYD